MVSAFRLLVVAFWLFLGLSVGAKTPASWPEYSHDPQRTSFTPDSCGCGMCETHPVLTGNPRVTETTHSSGSHYRPPLLFNNTLYYVGRDDHVGDPSLFTASIDTSRDHISRRWAYNNATRFDMHRRNYHTVPAVCNTTGVAYASCRGDLCAIGTDGKLLWQMNNRTFDVTLPLTLTPDCKTLFTVVTLDWWGSSKLYAFDTTGPSVKWAYELNEEGYEWLDRTLPVPAVSSDGASVYVECAGSHRLCKLNARTGEVVWEFGDALGNSWLRGAMLDEATKNPGVITVVNGNLIQSIGLDDGKAVWHWFSPSIIYASLALVPKTQFTNRKVYFTAGKGDDATVWSLIPPVSSGDPTLVEWSYSALTYSYVIDTRKLMFGQPTVDRNGNVYVPSAGTSNYIHALLPDGSIRWVFYSGVSGRKGFITSPVIGDERLYLLGRGYLEGIVLSISCENTPPPSPNVVVDRVDEDMSLVSWRRFEPLGDHLRMIEYTIQYWATPDDREEMSQPGGIMAKKGAKLRDLKQGTAYNVRVGVVYKTSLNFGPRKTHWGAATNFTTLGTRKRNDHDPKLTEWIAFLLVSGVAIGIFIVVLVVVVCITLANNGRLVKWKQRKDENQFMENLLSQQYTESGIASLSAFDGSSGGLGGSAGSGGKPRDRDRDAAVQPTGQPGGPSGLDTVAPGPVDPAVVETVSSPAGHARRNDQAERAIELDGVDI